MFAVLELPLGAVDAAQEASVHWQAAVLVHQDHIPPPSERGLEGNLGFLQKWLILSSESLSPSSFSVCKAPSG